MLADRGTICDISTNRLKSSKPPIVIVAPYSPVGSRRTPHLGSANKIGCVIRILARFGHPILLVDSAHNELEFKSSNVKRSSIDARQTVIKVTPFTVKLRPLGKLLNLFFTRKLARRIARLKPVLVWIYNGLAFESKFTLELNSIWPCPSVLELEDHPLARKRGTINIKPKLDFWYFKKVMPKINLVTCVNAHLQNEPMIAAKKTILFPVTLNPKLFQSGRGKEPFSEHSFALGYFGGLSKEKGADVILETVKQLPKFWRVLVTGAGPLISDFEKISKEYPDRIEFVPNASEEQLYKMMLQCDVIVNPHKPIIEMGNGIFPFKVIEALASGRLLISTPLPDCGIELSGKLMSFDGTSADLIAKLLKAEKFYQKVALQMPILIEELKNRYSEDSIFSTLKNALPQLSNG